MRAIGDDFGESGGIAVAVGFSVGAEGEFSHRDVAATRSGISAGLGFGQAETGDLGLAERHARNHRVVGHPSPFVVPNKFEPLRHALALPWSRSCTDLDKVLAAADRRLSRSAIAMTCHAGQRKPAAGEGNVFGVAVDHHPKKLAARFTLSLTRLSSRFACSSSLKHCHSPVDTPQGIPIADIDPRHLPANPDSHFTPQAGGPAAIRTSPVPRAFSVHTAAAASSSRIDGG